MVAAETGQKSDGMFATKIHTVLLLTVFFILFLTDSFNILMFLKTRVDSQQTHAAYVPLLFLSGVCQQCAFDL